jgi:hypothetical protein
MKKLMVGAVAVVAAVMIGLAPQAKASDAGAAGLLSVIMPGAGEWYNNGWQGSFPWGECIVGHICFLVQISSVLDAVNGNADGNLRIDFWSAPAKK